VRDVPASSACPSQGRQYRVPWSCAGPRAATSAPASEACAGQASETCGGKASEACAVRGQARVHRVREGPAAHRADDFRTDTPMDPALLVRTRRWISASRTDAPMVQRLPYRRGVLSVRQQRVRTRRRRTGSSPRLITAAGSETTWSAARHPRIRQESRLTAEGPA
jgi:hypothetical protein